MSSQVNIEGKAREEDEKREGENEGGGRGGGERRNVREDRGRMCRERSVWEWRG